MLFGAELQVRPGEIVALLGTNGAGKSTLLRAMCGLVPSRGSIRLGDRDLSGASAEQIVRAGVALMPGGKAVFPTLTVDEHLRLATWTFRGDHDRIQEDLAVVTDLFPILAERGDQLAGDLSGGEQQQLALATTLLLRPEVLLIDELSLGLAPMVVAALCDVVRQLNAGGITVVVVEQSVNVALTLAERAVFMEKGTGALRGAHPRAAGPTRHPPLGLPPGRRADATDDDGPDDAVGSVDLTRFDRTDAAAAPGSGGPVLVCSGVTKRFGGVNALSDVHLEVGAG